MWFLYSILALFFWSGSDLFSKIGCRDASDKYSHFKMTMAVGIVMGLHAAYEMIFGGVVVTADVILKYLPVSALYIASMTIGYLGLRYIELAISSPICNSSGAIVALLSISLYGISEFNIFQIIALIAVCGGVIGLGIVNMTEDEDVRAARQAGNKYKYVPSIMALAIPVIYALLDALGTFGDSLVLQTLDEEAANCAYELTFLAVAVICAIYVLGIKKQKLLPRLELPKYIGASFETVGQFFYIFAIADADHIMFSAPIISSYCALSVVWSRLILKEKLSKKHYLMIAITVVGIAVLGLFDEM
jgi:uncharacterized membrane protein